MFTLYEFSLNESTSFICFRKVLLFVAFAQFKFFGSFSDLRFIVLRSIVD